MIKIVICDDSRDDVSFLTSCVSEWSRQSGIEVSAQTYSSAEEYLMKSTEEGDILLLDVEMKSLSGIELAKNLRKNKVKSEIIFITSHTEFIGEGYEVDALHYLIKPVEKHKLFTVLDKAAAKLTREREYIIVKSDESQLKIYLDEICYCEARLHETDVHTKTGTVTARESFGTFCGKLGEGFFRVHRSYTVSLKSVREISRKTVTMDDGTSLPLSRGLYDKLSEAFINAN